MPDRNPIETSNPVRESISVFSPFLKHVTIDQSAVKSVSSGLAKQSYDLPDWRAPVFPDENQPNTVATDVIDFLFIGNTINFSFRDFNTGEKFTVEYDDAEWEGAFGMWACLKRAYDSGVPILDGEYLRDLTIQDVEHLFEPVNGTVLPMLKERHRVLTNIGNQLSTKYEGRFHKFLSEGPTRLYANGRGIVERLVDEFPSFDDSYTVSTENGTMDIHFYKRAQLAPGMIYGRFQTTDHFNLEDPGNFTVFADYNLPNVLRHLGILKYDSQLQKKVNSERRIEEGSREEIEIRVATIHAADELLRNINQERNEPIYGPHLDAKLFFMRDDVETPVHKTRTTSY